MADVHVIRVLATDTEHEDAVNDSPFAPPYVTATACPLVGPKFDPSITMDSPPSVPRVLTDARLTSVIAGAVYDSVAEERALVWPPTVTSHLWPAPTPTGDVQVISEFALDTEHDVAV